jgi:hypothetical protein
VASAGVLSTGNLCANVVSSAGGDEMPVFEDITGPLSGHFLLDSNTKAPLFFQATALKERYEPQVRGTTPF